MAKAVMIQGTMSGAGKSALVAALCRILARDGYSPAPFKSQNMALNSGVTRDGHEMGRAQIMQAYAAGVEPRVEMNPILLKPTGEASSQVMVMGSIHGVMSAAEYQGYKRELIPVIREAYDTLQRDHDIIVIEGAGSCSEINLKENDIVNMGLADMLSVPVLLAGDIDRGGVFAQLLGSVCWMTDKEKQLLKGFIINKFRGDVSLLTPGLSMLTERTGYDVLGVVPFVGADLEDEDSMSERLEGRGRGSQSLVDIAVIRLPMISNFTDLDVFDASCEVSLRYVKSSRELGEPDLIVIPGSKNTISDKLWMDGEGLSDAIKELAGRDVPVFGVCGGYQMLGFSIEDDGGAEHEGEACGLGLLPIDTVFSKEKLTRRVSGYINPVGGIFKELSGMCFEGYEIHMGQSRGRGDEAKPELPTLMQSGNVYGTYVHGIFDRTANAIVGALCEKKGIGFDGGSFDMYEYRQKQYDILADAVREALDMERIYKILENGV